VVSTLLYSPCRPPTASFAVVANTQSFGGARLVLETLRSPVFQLCGAVGSHGCWGPESHLIASRHGELVQLGPVRATTVFAAASV
jgi:hypothetical protein